jgi:flagellum-specific ATP synthase
MRIFQNLDRRLSQIDVAKRVGRVRKVSQGFIEASGPFGVVGEICEIESSKEAVPFLAEIVSVKDDRVVLVPYSHAPLIRPNAKVTAKSTQVLAPVGDKFRGRAIDALGHAIDGKGDPADFERRPLLGHILAPMERSEPKTFLETGVRAIDGLLSIGQGQRVGIFAASGVGKTTLIRQLATQIQADHCILCLVGERGREVEAIWSKLSSSPAQHKFTCVAATSDVSAMLRARAVHQALALAEEWRARGRHVILIVDSVTRYAMALREIGLAAGAPPTLRAYTPNVFAALPRLVERCGAAKDGGAITAVLTVLSETDDVDDPIVEVMKSLLDGHIILSRPLAEQGHFPAIDVPKSVSRQSEDLIPAQLAQLARKAIQQLSLFEDSKLLINNGIYKLGGNVLLDEAIGSRSNLMSFLQQSPKEHSSLGATLDKLSKIFARTPLNVS